MVKEPVFISVTIAYTIMPSNLDKIYVLINNNGNAWRQQIFHKFTSAYLKATFYLEHAQFVKVTPFIPMWLLSVYFAGVLYLMMYGWCIWYRKSGSSFDLSKEHCHSRLNLLSVLILGGLQFSSEKN